MVKIQVFQKNLKIPKLDQGASLKDTSLHKAKCQYVYGDKYICKCAKF